MRWDALAHRVLAGGRLTPEETLEAIAAPVEEVPALLAAAHRVRLAHWGRRVRIHVLRNAKSGSCLEDCSFCSQSLGAESAVERYGILPVEGIIEGARRAREARAVQYCIVTASGQPGEHEVATVCEAVERIKREVGIEVCASLGLLTGAQAARLAGAGVDRYNHNLETSERHFPSVCTTHAWTDRVRTIRLAREAGMEACSGGIIGLGETAEDLASLAFTLADLDVSSIPINFLDPRPGTPLADRPRPDPWRCLAVLAAFRLVHPRADLRAAGGREKALRSLAPLALLVATSFFTSGYLTTGGNTPDEDLRMVEDLGLEAEEIEVRARRPETV